MASIIALSCEFLAPFLVLPRNAPIPRDFQQNDP
jgi:hypothetical protein